MSACEHCGVEFAVGDWPFCPHGRGTATVVGDEMDQVIENNGTPHPIRFRSKQALDNHMTAMGLQSKVRHIGLQGSDKSPFTSDWSRGIDPVTLDNVKVLLSRRRGVRADDPPPSLPVEQSVRVLNSGVRGKYIDE